MKNRIGIIGFFVMLFVGFVWMWSYSYLQGTEEAYVPVKETPVPTIPSETGVFKRSDYALDYLNMPVDEKHQRTLAEYYDNRAYWGAPPYIPHPVKDERNMGGKACLKCHQNGGFVEKYKAYTPVTPHPEMVNCRQCHVPKKENGTFKSTNFYKSAPPKSGVNQALETSPPTIPHQLQMRENCLACHAGPSAPKEIRVTHPERVNCRQCHVPNNSSTSKWGSFNRKTLADEN